jgi:hypothetical protein
MLGVDFTNPKLEEQSLLSFWRRAEKIWPSLASIARDYLAIPASGVGVERLFNTARDVVSYRRHNLTPYTIGQIMVATCSSRFDDLAEMRQQTRDTEDADWAPDESDCESDDDTATEDDEDEYAYKDMISDDEGTDGEDVFDIETVLQEEPSSSRPAQFRPRLVQSQGSLRQRVLRERAAFRFTDTEGRR